MVACTSHVALRTCVAFKLTVTGHACDRTSPRGQSQLPVQSDVNVQQFVRAVPTDGFHLKKGNVSRKLIVFSRLFMGCDKRTPLR